MQIVNLIQGSPEWHAHRRNHFNASDAPAMLSVSKYTTRDQLLHQYATGLTKEADPNTQKLFDDGHRFEVLARPIAEKIIGDELSPMVATEGKLSASFDGITFEGDTIFEHKMLNSQLREFFATKQEGDALPVMYRAQMEQQLMISEAERCLFMASQWDAEGNLIEEHHCWYAPDSDLRSALLQGWTQFAIDLETYVPPVQVEKVVAETVEALPVPSVVVRGEITHSNIAEITPKFDAYLESIKTELSTDQDFADAEANAKNCREMGKRIEALQDNIIAQMVSVNEVNGILENYKKAFNQVGLRLEKAVKEQKESLKTQAIMQAKQAYNDHLNELQKSCVVMLNLVVAQPDFAGAIKGVKTIASMQSRINDALAAGKSALSIEYQNIALKSEYIKSNIEGYAHLINIADLATKDMDYIKLHIQSVKDAEDKRKAEHEAAIKAKAEAEARAKVEAEQRAKEAAEAQANAAQPINEAKPEVAEREAALSRQDQVSETQSSLAPKTEQAFNDLFTGTKAAPSRDEIVSLVADHYGVTHHQARTWLNDLFYAMAA